MRKLWLIASLFLPTLAGAASTTTFLNTGTMALKTTPAKHPSQAFTVTAGNSNKVALLYVNCDVGNTASHIIISSVTYGVATSTPAGPVGENFDTTNAHNLISAIYWVVNPPTGSNTMQVNLTASSPASIECYMNVASFYNVDQTNPVRSGTYQNTTGAVLDGSGNYSLTLTSDANDLTVTTSDGGPSGATTTNQTSDGTSVAGNFAAACDHATTAGASVTHTLGGGSAGADISRVGFSLKAIASGGGLSVQQQSSFFQVFP